MDRVTYYLKAYEKDTFIIPIDNLTRDIVKYYYHDMQVPLRMAEQFGKELLTKIKKTSKKTRRSILSWTQDFLQF